MITSSKNSKGQINFTKHSTNLGFDVKGAVESADLTNEVSMVRFCDMFGGPIKAGEDGIIHVLLNESVQVLGAMHFSRLSAYRSFRGIRIEDGRIILCFRGVI